MSPDAMMLMLKFLKLRGTAFALAELAERDVRLNQ
jgi:hypothetical protein